MFAVRSQATAERDRKLRFRRDAQPPREDAGTRCLERESKLGAAARLGRGKRRREARRGAGRREVELDWRGDPAQELWQIAAADREPYRLVEQDAAPRAAHPLSARNTDLERLEHQLDRPAARELAVAQPRGRHLQPQLEVADQRAERLAAAAEAERDAAEPAVDAGRAGEELSQPGERRVPRADFEREGGRRRRDIELDATLERHPRDGGCDRRTHAALVGVYAELRIAHVGGEPDQALHVQREIGVDRQGTAQRQRVLRQLLVGQRRVPLLPLDVEQRPQVQRGDRELAGEARPCTAEPEHEAARELRLAEDALEVRELDRVSGGNDLAGERCDTELGQRFLQQVFDLGEVRGAGAEAEAGGAAAGVDHAVRVQPRARALEVERERPRGVALAEVLRGFALDRERAGHRPPDATPERKLQRPAPSAGPRELFQVEQAAHVGVTVLVLDDEVADRQPLELDGDWRRRRLGSRVRPLGRARRQHPVRATVGRAREAHAPVRQRDAAHLQPAAQRRQQIDADLGVAERREFRHHKPGRIQDAQVAGAERCLAAEDELERAVEPHRPSERRCRPRGERLAPARGVDRDAEERDRRERDDRQPGERRERGGDPARGRHRAPHPCVTAAERCPTADGGRPACSWLQISFEVDGSRRKTVRVRLLGKYTRRTGLNSRAPGGPAPSRRNRAGPCSATCSAGSIRDRLARRVRATR